ncbi:MULTISPECIES: NADP-dependent oxidoreductase [Staphylococcus]|uniref:NADP-dependent oxidoreductase n=1 Tax=Staphylococcus TaxID=1279 RepID=UPI001AEBFAF4|nr:MULTISPECIES: NADP-dependent oxidoreductase [Staphylococcus]MEB7367633.1 NADP-dependent oxidoreductase [Staphylococcus borealis]MEB7461033.1 NADP-dependent oxidoreductase [Staphylococcus borealis]MEB8116124.1 NADP-dependent oxidoreductase [Staphylococcus saprophyticus]
MKAIVIENYGHSNELVEKEVETPLIQDNQILIEQHATSINPIDWKLREGYLKDSLDFDFPIILGWDSAGVIKKAGKDVTQFNVGDRVFARPSTTPQGTYAEYVATEESLAAKVPDNVSFEEAASVPLAGLTAWQCLVDFSQIKKGDKVLIQAGSGGVGSFAIQFAKHFGAYVATTASDKNEKLVKDLGADYFINYKEENFNEVLNDYDIVVDTLGGEILDQSFDVLKSGGKLVSTAGEPDQQKAKENNIKAGFIWLEENGKQLSEIAELLENGEVKPVIGHTLSLSEEGLREAHELSETHHAKGKIVIKIK